MRWKYSCVLMFVKLRKKTMLTWKLYYNIYIYTHINFQKMYTLLCEHYLPCMNSIIANLIKKHSIYFNTHCICMSMRNIFIQRLSCPSLIHHWSITNCQWLVSLSFLRAHKRLRVINEIIKLFSWLVFIVQKKQIIKNKRKYKKPKK